MKKFFLCWQDKISERRPWYIIGSLIHENNSYTFSYTKKSHEIPNFKRFYPFDKDTVTAQTLFPFFQNRILSSNRPEYKNLLEWMDIAGEDQENDDTIALDVLTLSEGKRATDTFEIFACPQEQNGELVIRFFSHGVSHTHLANISAVTEIVKKGGKLFLMLDCQNQYEPQAIAIRSDDPVCILGYVPRYLVGEILPLLLEKRQEIDVKVVKVNSDAPLSYRYLCELKTAWPKGFMPFSGDEYQTY